MYQHKKNYHRLKNGEFINLDDDSIKDLIYYLIV